ncbi:MAG: hypothetical protein ACP5HW_03670 [Candidatus Micrarchaeia archaeon]
MGIKESVKDLAMIAIGYLIVAIAFEVTGITLASLNSTVNNSVIPVSYFTSGANTLVPIVNIVFLILVIYVLLEVFGAGNLFNLA